MMKIIQIKGEQQMAIMDIFPAIWFADTAWCVQTKQKTKKASPGWLTVYKSWQGTSGRKTLSVIETDSGKMNRSASARINANTPANHHSRDAGSRTHGKVLLLGDSFFHIVQMFYEENLRYFIQKSKIQIRRKKK